MDTKYYLTSINFEQNRSRFYSITIEHDLLGFTIIRCWGRIGSKGKRLTETFNTIEDAEKEVKKLLNIRTRHGYLKKQDNCTPAFISKSNEIIQNVNPIHLNDNPAIYKNDNPKLTTNHL